MNDKVKEILTTALHEHLKQVAPYVIEFDNPWNMLGSYLYCLGKETGSTVKYIMTTKEGKDLYRVSDPLCRILEETGVNA